MKQKVFKSHSVPLKRGDTGRKFEFRLGQDISQVTGIAFDLIVKGTDTRSIQTPFLVSLFYLNGNHYPNEFIVVGSNEKVRRKAIFTPLLVAYDSSPIEGVFREYSPSSYEEAYLTIVHECEPR